MSEPGVTLGRLIAAERNALAAVSAAKDMREKLGAALDRIDKLEAEQVAMKTAMQYVNVRLALMRGAGPTVR